MNDPPTTPADGAFAEFYRRELAGQTRRATLIVGERELACDIVHEAFVAVFRRWASIAEPGPYLSTTVLNACRDATRRAGRHRTAVGLHAAMTPQAAPAADAAAADDAVWAALAHLPFRQRAAVVLRFYEQRSETEIALALDCRPGSVGPLITRALRTLRTRLPRD